MKRVVKASWVGCTPIRSQLTKLIENGASLDELYAEIDGMEASGLDSDDAISLRTWVKGAYVQEHLSFE